MDRMDLYTNIAERTQGDIYVGVVGPVRTGKSTFIKRFMDLFVVPDIENEFIRERVVDELPQSGAGKSIMTTQPKFVPNEAVELNLGEKCSFRVRMVDCVGYMIPGAIGQMENDMPRMVRTPWFDYDIPFEEAAEIGTRKVIAEHSTIGIVMTTDGSITDIDRKAYVDAENRVISELKEQGKPFVVVLNSRTPEAEQVKDLQKNMEAAYGTTVIPMDVMKMSMEAAGDLLTQILMEFPIRTVKIAVPSWMRALGEDHWLVARALSPINDALPSLNKMKDYNNLVDAIASLDGYMPAAVMDVNMGNGSICIDLRPVESMFYNIIGEQCGYEIKDDLHLMEAIKGFVAAKREYDRIEGALSDVKRIGYGLVPPDMNEIVLEEPEIVRHGSRFGVKLKARASGLHIIRVDIESEVSPLVGTEEQSEEFAGYLAETFENEPNKIWQTNIFGKPLYDLVCDGMNNKVNAMPEDVRRRLQETLQKIVNQGCNGLICVML